MIGILYFSSTGNSLQIAERTREHFGGKIVYIPNYTGDGSEFEKLFIVTPIYSFGLPKHTYDLLPRLNKSKEIVIILNYGGMVGGADYFTLSYAKKLGLNVVNISTVKMPENFTLYFTVPKFYLNSAIKKSFKRIDKVLDKIEKQEYTLPKKKKTKEATYVKNKSNWHLIGRDFSTTDACTKCQKCVKLCPAKNIKLENGKIVFGDNCVACLGCYHRCPNKAIVFKNKSKKYRYINPNIDESKIGKDI